MSLNAGKATAGMVTALIAAMILMLPKASLASETDRLVSEPARRASRLVLSAQHSRNADSSSIWTQELEGQLASLREALGALARASGPRRGALADGTPRSVSGEEGAALELVAKELARTRSLVRRHRVRRNANFTWMAASQAGWVARAVEKVADEVESIVDGPRAARQLQLLALQDRLRLTEESLFSDHQPSPEDRDGWSLNTDTPQLGEQVRGRHSTATDPSKGRLELH